MSVFAGYCGNWPRLAVALGVLGCADPPLGARFGDETVAGTADAGAFAVEPDGRGGQPAGGGESEAEDSPAGGGARGSAGGPGEGAGGAGGPGEGAGGAGGGPGAAGGPGEGAGGAGGPGEGADDDAGAGPSPADCAPLAACGLTCVDLQADPENCGQCGRTCVLSNGEAACTAGACALAGCLTGFFDRDGDTDNGCETESDCVPGAPCATACASEGRADCSGDLLVCTPPAETCNAVDDDCNGACDDGAVPGCRIPVHRGVGNGHLYTTDLAAVQTPPFQIESPAFFHLYTQSIQGMRPVFLCRKGDGKFLLTSDQACEIGVAPDRTLGFWSPEPLCGATPLYRLYSPASGDHFFTISAPERDAAVAQYGYRDEGLAGHVWTSP